MEHLFKAVIYKVGINPCVDVPERISKKLTAHRGYIPIKGKINGHPFHQTLVPVKEKPYRLYVNIPMMKGGNVKVGDRASFIIEQDKAVPKTYKMPAELRTRLKEQELLVPFNNLTPSRRKEILRYLLALKTVEAKERTMVKIVNMLLEKKKSWW